MTQETNQIGHSRYFEYDAAGRLERRIDRLGRVIEFDYNTLDQVTAERWYENEQAVTPVRTLTHIYDAMGQLRGAGDPAATYDYLPDGLGRLKTETQTIAGFTPSFDIEFTSTYNRAGSRDSLKATLGSTADFQNSYGYDFLQRLTSLTQQGQGGGNTVAAKHITFAYNAAGQFDTIGRYADAQGAELVANTFYKYDSLGRLESMIHSEDAEAPTSGWGEGVLAGYIYIYDAASRLWQVNSRHVVDATNVDENSVYGYDNTNQLTVASHDAQPSEFYTYDANGNRTGGGYQTGLNNQLSSDGTYTYVYDAEGNRIQRTKIADGTITRYSYDHRNRLIGVDQLDPAQASTANQPAVWGWGVSSDGGTFQIPNPEYEPGGGTSSGGFEGVSFTLTGGAEGGAAGSLWMSQCSSWVEDPFDVWIEDGSATYLTDFGLLGGLNCEDVVDPEGITFTIDIVDDAIVEGLETFFIHIAYPSDPGNVVVLEGSIADNDGEPVDEFLPASFSAAVSPAVEGTNVVLTATADAAVQFEYWVEDVSAYQGTHYTDPNYTYAENWAAVPESWQIAFPTNYLPTNDGTLSFKIHVRVVGYLGTEIVLEADIFDREEIIVQTVDYAYDIYNRLVRRTLDDDGPSGENEPTDTFFSWENGQIVFQFDSAASAEPSHRYLWNPVAIDQILADENALNEVLWPLTDHLGTARDIAQYDDTSDCTTIVNHRNYESFGRLISESDDNYSLAFGFTGVYYDIATGLNYHHHRWYDAATGRWINEDPIGFAAGDTNLQGYVFNSPTNFVDPSGLESGAIGAAPPWYLQFWYDLGGRWIHRQPLVPDPRRTGEPNVILQMLGDFYNRTPFGELFEGAIRNGINPVGETCHGIKNFGNAVAGLPWLSDTWNSMDDLARQDAVMKPLITAHLAGAAGALRGIPSAGNAPATSGQYSARGLRGPAPGSISGNPANQKLETGVPLKDGSGWVKRWYRISPQDEQAYRDACGDRISQLHTERRSFPSEAAQRQYHMEQMSKFRTEWLKNFLRTRKY